jgi:hypothetical protein
VMSANTESGPGFEETHRRLLGAAGLATCLCLTALVLWAPAAPAATNNIFTVAGTGTGGFSGDGGPATAAQLHGPAGVAPTADGGYLITDTVNHRVRRVSPAGTITTVAGSGTGGFSGDGGPATDARLNYPDEVALTANGGFLIADTQNNRVRRVSPSGTITTAAGSGTGGFSGDGGPAIAAELNGPAGVAVTADGGFLISEQDNARVRRVSPSGTITTAAGNGAFGFSGDGGPATAAGLYAPAGVAPTADGGFLIGDIGDHRVRRVSPAGTITTVAGTGTVGFLGDGGLATAAQLGQPFAVAQTADGGFLIADYQDNRVRFVDADLGIPQPPPPSDTTCLGHPVTIVAVAGAGLTRGTPGNDVIVGLRTGADRISSGGGRDLVCSRGGNDVVRTGAGADRVAAGSGADTVSTGSGRDRVSTGPGNDRLRLAERMRDRADCGPGRDRVRHDGADRLRGCERIRRS